MASKLSLFSIPANVKVRNLKAPVGLQLGTVGSRASIERGAVVSFQFGKIDVKSQYIDVLNVSRYDAVIGTVTMRRWGIKLDFGTDCWNLSLDTFHDDDMSSTSKAKKALDGITPLSADGSNWPIWLSRVVRASKSISTKYGALLDSKPTSAADSIAADADLLNAIICLIPDSIYLRYISYTTTFDLITALKCDYNVSNSMVEAQSVANLFTTMCTHESQINEHLDYLGTLRESLIRANSDISDQHFIDAIISTIPPRLSSLCTSLRHGYELHNQLNSLTGDNAKSLSVIELLQYIRSQTAHISGAASPDNANFSGNPTSQSGSRRGRGRGRGGNDSGSASTVSDPDNSKCHNCGGTGHWSPVCPSPKQPRSDADGSASQAMDAFAPPALYNSPPSHPSVSVQHSQTSGSAGSDVIVELIEEEATSAWSAIAADELETDLAIWHATRPDAIDVSDLMEHCASLPPVDADIDRSGVCASLSTSVVA
ncbi:hypothetical protein D9611_015017 [Ephemerocybe angulata]|uniref:CCHC-type domain-containing protein n=1 Tax=Ephemerocybe angulata TaxID=980116 RepID=A0A8H5C2P1_9AGAR|nr:hypothetical protein D9611_015017 [Tulosesus angulatus]